MLAKACNRAFWVSLLNELHFTTDPSENRITPCLDSSINFCKSYEFRCEKEKKNNFFTIETRASYLSIFIQLPLVKVSVLVNELRLSLLRLDSSVVE